MLAMFESLSKDLSSEVEVVRLSRELCTTGRRVWWEGDGVAGSPTRAADPAVAASG